MTDTDRLSQLTAEVEALRGALRTIQIGCDITHEQFVMLGPSFALVQARAAASVAKDALAKIAALSSSLPVHPDDRITAGQAS